MRTQSRRWRRCSKCEILALNLRLLILDVLTGCIDARKPKFKITIDDCSMKIATTVSGIVRRSKRPATRVLGILQTV